MTRHAARLVEIACLLLFWLAVLLYIGFFIADSLQRYNAFLMHALDLGNMDQAAWFTLHGQFFHFTNMRLPLGVEAFGTDTRLSFHVEPIWLPLSLLYLIWADPRMLLIVQTVVLASGAIPARRMALRYLGGSAGSPLASLVIPLLYLLYPALQAANLYEFHPVTLTAALLLWAIDMADQRRYLWFTVAALAAIACKEEIGLLVALLGLWIALIKGDRLYGLLWFVGSAGWSLVAVGLVVPHFHGGPSPYVNRYQLDQTATDSASTGLLSVVKTWLHHPGDLWAVLTMSPKFGFLHRWLMPTGYLALVGLPVLILALPSLGIIMLSSEVHMYSGLAHYSAELVPPAIVATIWAVRQLSCRLGVRLGLSPGVAVTLLSLYALGAALANERVNGFTPLAQQFAWPLQTAHQRVVERMLALIPSDASVSAQDTLNPHLGDRADIYLWPDWMHLPLPAGQHVVGPSTRTADWIALDMTASTNPAMSSETVGIVKRILGARQYGIAFADDGVLLLHRAQPGPYQLPRQFFSFIVPGWGDTAPLPMTNPLQIAYHTDDGGILELEGYRIDRREDINLRNPDVLMTTYWRRIPPVHVIPAGTDQDVKLGLYVTNADGAVSTQYTDTMTLDWLPTHQWPVNQTITVQTPQLAILTLTPGTVDLDLLLFRVDRSGQGDDQAWGDRLLPQVTNAPEPLETVEAGTIVQLARVAAPF